MIQTPEITPEALVAQFQIPDQRFFAPVDLADLFDVSRSTIYTLIEEAELPAVKIRGSQRVPRFAVIEYLRRQVAKSDE